jgi:hypothetical protein
MRKRKGILYSFLLLCIGLFMYTVPALAQPLAFPGAEGHGAYTTGGRGGVVYEVTNLNDSGEGSLRAAIEAKGARTVVFRVSGTIQLKKKLSIKNGDITIAGQTAPGDGICLRDYTMVVDANNVIIRYIRSRMGDVTNQEDDAMNGRFKKNIIIDHCSMSWSVDEAASFYSNENFTMQWCIISESMYQSVHDKGKHGYGGIWGGINASFHHNLLAHHSSRNPRFNGGRDGYGSTPENEVVDFRNNVIYNWGSNSAYGGEKGSHNMVNNYYKAGPATSSKKNRIVEPYDVGNWFIEGNYVDGYEAITANNWAGGVQPSGGTSLDLLRVYEPFPTGPIETQTPQEAYEAVLKYAGCSLPNRDTIDARIIEETRTGTATFGGSFGAGKGIIDTQDDVGGWIELTSTEAPLDSDHDGMPDAWEDEMGLNKFYPEDRNNVLEDGTTVLEAYLNSLVNYENSGVGLESIKLLTDLKVYPNPASIIATVQYQLENESQLKYRLIDMSGKTVMENQVERQYSGFNSFNLDVNQLKKGVYFLNLIDSKTVNTTKLIVR